MDFFFRLSSLLVTIAFIVIIIKSNLHNGTIAATTWPFQPYSPSEDIQEGLQPSIQKYVLNYTTADEIYNKLQHIRYNDLVARKPVISRYGNDVRDRSQRFPSIEDRVKLYLSSWYLPPCHRNDPSAVRFTEKYKLTNVTNDQPNEDNDFIDVYVMEDKNLRWKFSSEIKPDIMFYLDRMKVLDLVAIPNSTSNLLLAYSRDILETMVPSMTRIGWNNDHLDPPLILQFGDMQYSVAYNERRIVNIPRIQKFRHSIDPNDMDRVLGIRMSNTSDTTGKVQKSCLETPRVIPNTLKSPQSLPAIIWKLNTVRHYGHIAEIDKLDVLPFSEKKDIAIFRGAMTGSHHWKPHLSDEENCHLLLRCDLVMKYAFSDLVDARFTAFPAHKIEEVNVTNPEFMSHWSKRDVNTTAKVQLSGERFTIEEMLRYKAIINLEGNDVSSGLKWSLFSRSVVIMSYPTTATSWAMEELLEPWIHFVPVKSDFSDLNEAVQWIIENPSQAEIIALRGRLWIEDMLFHDDSEADNKYIQDEILKRYRSNFIKVH